MFYILLLYRISIELLLANPGNGQGQQQVLAKYTNNNTDHLTI